MVLQKQNSSYKTCDKNVLFFSPRIQRSGRRWWSRTSLPQESSPATEPSQSTPLRCGASSRPTWRSRLRVSRERPSKKRPELWRKCEAASQPRAAFMFTNNLLFPSCCAFNLQVTRHWTFPITLGVLRNHTCTCFHFLNTFYFACFKALALKTVCYSPSPTHTVNQESVWRAERSNTSYSWSAGLVGFLHFRNSVGCQ